MIKILCLANVRVPTEKAHGIQIMKMCEAFARRGAEVELVVPRRRNLIVTDPFKYYGIPMRTFTIKKLPSLDVARFGQIGFWIQHLSFLLFAIPYVIAARANVVYSRDIILCFILSVVRVHGVVFEDHEPIKASAHLRIPSATHLTQSHCCGEFAGALRIARSVRQRSLCRTKWRRP